MTSPRDPALAALLGSTVPPLDGPDTLTAFAPVWTEAVAGLDDSVDRAALGGFMAPSVGLGFVAGYRSALDRMLPSLRGRAAALCVTEAGGNHPRAIAARLAGDPPVVTGEKVWSTAADTGDVLLVAASRGTRNGRNDIGVAIVPAAQSGVTFHPMPPTPFVPDIPHYRVELDQARVERVLDGDGYDQIVKPFRTVEDIHVSAALTGHLLGVATHFGAPNAVRSDLIHALLGLRALARLDPLDPTGHIGLAGWLSAQERGLARLEDSLWPLADESTVARWKRDSPLLGVAGRARARRLTRGWEALGQA